MRLTLTTVLPLALALALVPPAFGQEIAVKGGTVSGVKNDAGRFVGFRLKTAGGLDQVITFGSLGTITAGDCRVEANGALRFSRLQAQPTPKLGADSWVQVEMPKNLATCALFGVPEPYLSTYSGGWRRIRS